MRVWLLLFCSVVVLNAESAAGIKWTAPAGWKTEAPRPMRAATYSIAPDGECAVNFFGAGQGGGVDANINSYLDTFVVRGEQYSYRVRAEKSGAYSNYSDVAGVRATTP